jgi:hypothetical protein
VAGFAVPDSVGELQELFEMVVSWRDSTLANDVDARQGLVLAGYGLGAQRAEALGREMRAVDVEFGLALLCKWPLKPETNAELLEQMDRVRADTVAAVSQGQRVEVDPSFLRLSLDELYDRLGTEGPPLAAA